MKTRFKGLASPSVVGSEVVGEIDGKVVESDVVGNNVVGDTDGEVVGPQSGGYSRMGQRDLR